MSNDNFGFNYAFPFFLDKIEYMLRNFFLKKLICNYLKIVLNFKRSNKKFTKLISVRALINMRKML